jgi:hypothetical protein
MEACSKAYQLPNGNEKDALLNLGKWGMELFQLSMENAESMDMTLHADGKFAFTGKRHPERISLTLDPSATECSSSFWTAYLMQCPNLLLLKKRFDATICSHRWFQFSCLQKSTGDEQPHDHRDADSHSSVASRGENDEGITALEPNEDTRHRIDKWVAGENSKEIPQDAWH